MKRNLIITCLLLASSSLFAQWGLNGNAIGPVNWLGSINNQPLRMRTNDTERFKIMPFGNANTDGRVAMGNNLAVGFIPRSRLHLHHDDVSNVSVRFTNLSTGTNPGDGFEVGYNSTSAPVNLQFAELNNRENTAMKFLTDGMI